MHICRPSRRDTTEAFRPSQNGATPFMTARGMAAMVLLLFTLFLSAAVRAEEARRVPFADPFILLHDGVYYAYGTLAADGIAVMTSADLLHWRENAGRAKGALALHKDDSYGEKWFWAPEVYRVGDKFHMYYSADEHVCVAVADSPLGPFVQTEKKPLVSGEKAIDNTLFIDDDGQPYMFFSRFNDGLNIWSVEMERDCLHVRPEMLRYCVRAWQPWERREGRVNEGAFVLKHKGRYYLTYSGNGYTSPFYGIGCAVADSINGPWRKYDHNPLLQRGGGLSGVGHHSFFRDREGRLRIVFHAHNSATQIHPRHMYIGSASFQEEAGGAPRLVISQEFIVPVIAE